MPNTLLLLSSLLLTLHSSAAFSQNAVDLPEQETAITQLIAQYLAVREQNDEQALLNLLTHDVDQLTTSGILRSGQDRVSSGSLASSQNNSGRRSINVETIRFIRPDVAIVNGRYNIVDRTDRPDSHYLTTFVVVTEDERWKISAIRNMSPTQ